MKTLLYVCAALMMALTPITAHAATDVSGTWTGSFAGPDGGAGFQISFTFKQDGDKLTGSVQGAQGDAIAITDGKIDGDKISFKVSFNGATITHEGTISAAGDEIKLTSKSDQGNFPGGEMTLKRSK
ncbi:MAG TPA: hypothetical protein VMQ60_07320 [Acidobacteriaceae bacterium]|jgi:hypothetical protein|nr:hypothetical protein [Acidobacteriaceae bacterium]